MDSFHLLFSGRRPFHPLSFLIRRGHGTSRNGGCSLLTLPPPLMDPNDEEEEPDDDDDELDFSPRLSVDDLELDGLSLLSLWLGLVGSVFQPLINALDSSLEKPLVRLAARLARPLADTEVY
ncbi:hypothetical protein ACOMHN_061521 [Nucella lapillus]